MAHCSILLFLLAYFSALPIGAPIKEGEDVGRVRKVSRKVNVYGQELYPFIVHITVTETKDHKSIDQICAGVIVTKDIVLTAAHCLYGKLELAVVVHAGIVDVAWEKNKGQEVQMKDYVIHKKYHSECFVGNRCCFEVNDLAIVWLKDELNLGPTVEKAVFNRQMSKPVGKEGWILGWGLNSDEDEPTMLQRGLVKVMQQGYCQKFNSGVYINQNTLCLSGVRKGTTSAFGDSGGPFVINNVVYGISSVGIYKIPCFSEIVDVYTDVARYLGWMNKNIKAGPPKERNNNVRTITDKQILLN